MHSDRELVLEIDLHATCQLAPSLPRDALAVLRLFDGRRSLKDVVEESRLPLETTLEVVRRLGNLGLLRLAPRGRPDNRLPGPQARRWLGRLVSRPFWEEDEPEEEPPTEPPRREIAPMDLQAVPMLLERSLEHILEERLADVPDILDDEPGVPIWSGFASGDSPLLSG